MLARQIAIGFGIAVIFPLLVYYGVATIYPPPETEQFVAAVTSPGPNATPEERQRYTEQEQARREEQRKRHETHDTAAKDFARHVVFISTPLGVAAILIGAYIPLYAIGTGLIFGGIFTVGSGYFGYWRFLPDSIRFASLLMGFIILLFVGYYRVAGANTRRGSP